MSKQEWLMHRADVLDAALPYAIGDEQAIMRNHVAGGCKSCAARRRTRRSNVLANQRNAAMRSLGLVKTPYGWE